MQLSSHPIFRDAVPLPALSGAGAPTTSQAFPDGALGDQVAELRCWESDAKPMPSAHNSGIAIPAEFDPAAVLYAGRSFGGAVRAANARAGTRGTSADEHTAQAVLQAKDGGYYLVPLFDDEGGAVLLDPLGLKHFEGTRVRSMAPQLQAVVDARRWVNFSGSSLEQ